MELGRGTFDVLVDADDIASIEWKLKVDLPLDPGHHTQQLKAGRHPAESTPTTPSTEIVNFRGHVATIWPLHVASIAKTDLAIALKR